MLISLIFCPFEREPAVPARCLLNLSSSVVIEQGDLIVVPEQTNIDILDPSANWVRDRRHWIVAGKLIDTSLNHIEPSLVRYRVYPATNEDLRRFQYSVPADATLHASTP